MPAGVDALQGQDSWEARCWERLVAFVRRTNLGSRAWRWCLLSAGVLLALQAAGQGAGGWLIPVGYALMVAAGVLRVSRVLLVLGLLLPAAKYFLFLMPILKVVGGITTGRAVLGWLGCAAWDGSPLVLAVLLGLFAAQRRMRDWALLTLTAGVFVFASVWMLRPYGWDPGALLFQELPGLVWAFGVDLTFGLLLGWFLVVMRAVVQRVPVRRQLAWLAGTTLVLVLTAFGQRSWDGRCHPMARPTERHSVAAVQSALPPFTAGFQTQFDRALYPMVLFSGMGPDLVIMAENVIQASPYVDPKTPVATMQRHVSAMGLGIAIPYSQAAFGVRDLTTSRVYFTDLEQNRPVTRWKDLERRVPGIDYPLGKLQKLFPTAYEVPRIQQAQSTPLMTLWTRTEEGNAQKPISKALILMGGEIRDGSLVRKVLRDKAITTALHSHIGGWLGGFEVTGAGVQARARLFELGLIGYRVGQASGTELFVPWTNIEAAPQTAHFGAGNLRFQAEIPLTRIDTGFVAFGWVLSLYLFPAGAILIALLALLPKTRPLVMENIV